MYRFLLLSLLSCVLLTVQAEDNVMEKCSQFLKPLPKGLACCNKNYKFEGAMEELKECMQLSDGSPSSCQREICMAKKNGFASDDGTIDKSKLKALIETNDDADLKQALIEDCVDGDLSKYGPPEFCDLIKLNMCVKLHVVVDCPDWSNNDHCSGSAEAAEECIKALA